MKIKGMSKNINDVANDNGVDLDGFKEFLTSNYEKGIDYVLNFGSIIIDSDREKEIVTKFKQSDPKYAEEIKQEKIKNEKLSNILITSGFNFDGYKVKKYCGYISGDDAISVERGTDLFVGLGTTNVSNAIMDSLKIIRRNALIELKEAAYEMGCNAVIGVDFDYITMEPETANLRGGTTYLPYLFGVTANGNAVIIEKE